MSFMIKILLAFFWMGIVPAGAGMCLVPNRDDVSLTERFVLGYVGFFCLGELLILPAVWLRLPLHVVTLLFGGISLLAALLGYGIYFRPGLKEAREQEKREFLTVENGYLLAAILLIAAESVVVALYSHMDADDAFYVATATTSAQTDSVFQVDPYTGFPYTELPSRYVLSPFPVLLAVFSSLFGNLHPAITAHLIIPLFLIPLSYMALFLVGKRLFPKDGRSQGIFLLILAVLGWFSAYSIYNGDNFRQIRIWQGKAVLAGCFLPLLVYLCMTVLLDRERRYSCWVLAAALTGACLLSSMGILLAPIVTGIFLIMSLFVNRSIRRFLAGALCLLPCLLLGVVYVLIR